MIFKMREFLEYANQDKQNGLFHFITSNVFL